MKQLWMLVGGNGAGKSTFYDLALRPQGMPFINADNIARELFPEAPEANSYLASQVAEQMRYQQLEEGNSFCFETVFSHPSKVDFIAQAKSRGYRIVLVVILVESAQLNIARVFQRAEEGGHGVPPDKITARIPRMLAHVNAAIPLCDEVRILDNSRLDQPFRPLISYRQGVRTEHVKPLPTWVPL